VVSATSSEGFLVVVQNAQRSVSAESQFGAENWLSKGHFATVLSGILLVDVGWSAVPLSLISFFTCSGPVRPDETDENCS